MKLKFKDCEWFLEYKSVKDDLIEYNVYFAIRITKKIDENLKKQFVNTLIMVSISFLYCCESVFTHIDDWEKLNNTPLPEKEDFSFHVNMKDIIGANYAHAKKFAKILK